MGLFNRMGADQLNDFRADMFSQLPSSGILGGGSPNFSAYFQSPPQMTPLQGMGLGSPFFTERPQQALPTQDFTPTRTNAMGPNAMSMMGMNPNFPNLVGPTSALPAEMQPQASQLRMYGMEDQLANPVVNQQQQSQQQSQQQNQQSAQNAGLVKNPHYRRFTLFADPTFGGNAYLAQGLNQEYITPWVAEQIRLYGAGQGG